MDNKEYEEMRDKVSDYDTLNARLTRVNNLLGVLNGNGAYVASITVVNPETITDKTTTKDWTITVPVLKTIDPNCEGFPGDMMNDLKEYLEEVKEQIESEMEDI